jgi:hypothetical protein
VAFINRNFILRYRLPLLVIASFFLRVILAFSVELGNDEVYYITYALYPDLSHFDHPPMVGWVIQFFTLDLLFDAEGWIRMGAVVFGTLSIIVIYHIGKELEDKVTGWYAALLYTISIYGFVITGIFMMPDGPQTFFWLLSILLIIKSVRYNSGDELWSSDKQSTPIGNKDVKQSNVYAMLLAGLAIGLALLSKYTSIFILAGSLLWMFKHRNYLTKWYIWAAGLIALACFLPVIIWNINNQFISFTFHTERVEVRDQLFRFGSFATEIAGQILYNNPITVVITVTALIAFFKGKLKTKNDIGLLLVCIALPLIIIFLGISLFRSTLPHWTGPAYLTLIPLAALWIRRKTLGGKIGALLPMPVRYGAGFLIIVIGLALTQLNYNVFFNKGINPVTGKRLGLKDITLDMYGWKQLSHDFRELYYDDLVQDKVDSSVVILSHRWFPAANLDYYVGKPSGIRVMTMAPIERTHKYAWITEYRGGYQLGMDAYFISSSYDYMDPTLIYSDYFTISEPDTIPIYRQSLLVKYFYVWKLYDLKKLPPAEYVIPER